MNEYTQLSAVYGELDLCMHARMCQDCTAFVFCLARAIVIPVLKLLDLASTPPGIEDTRFGK